MNSTARQAKKGVEVIEIRFAVQSETSVHKIFARDKGRTLREAIEPICQLKSIDIENLGVYLDTDRSASLPLDYDIYSVTGHVLHVIDYKAPTLSTDEVDSKIFTKKKTSSKSSDSAQSTPTSQRKANRAPSLASKYKEAIATGAFTKSKNRKSGNSKDKVPLGGELYPQRTSGGAPSLSRTSSAASNMLAQPGGRRRMPSEVAPPITSRLLGLSERSHKKEQSYEDDNGNEVVLRSNQKHRKQISMPADDFHNGETSPGGTLHKNRTSAAKLSVFSLQPQNSKEKEKMEILADLLDQWEKTGLPEMPPLANIGLPKFESFKFEIEDHWTNFIDKTDLTQRQKDQQEALWELLYTESEYIRALYVIHDLFMCCLLNIQNDGVLNEIELDRMFSNVTELTTTNSEFWSNELIVVLEHSRKNKCLFNPSLLKPAFTNFGEKFFPYTKYCIEQKSCSEYVKKNYQELTMFKAFVAWAEAQKQCNRLKLHDLLVKPMQRMTRYGLLLRAIHKKTDEEDVKQDLMDMIKNVDKFVTAVDQTLTRSDEKEKLTQTAARIEPYDAIELPLVDSDSAKILTHTYMTLDLLSPMPGCGKQLRYNLLEGALRLRDMSNKVDVHCILFTDMLLFTKPSKRDKLRIIKPPIRIDCLSIHEMKENSYILLVHLTDFGVAQAAYTLHGDNIGKWVKTFKKAQTLYMKAKEQTRKESEVYTDTELDDIGFSGPLVHKTNSDAVFSDFVDNDLEPNVVKQPFDSPQLPRGSSYSSLNGTEGEEVEGGANVGVSIPQSVSSPDIGRKHHTLPPNYKHPPKVKVQRKSSSSSGESAANGQRKHPAERRRRVGAGERYLTTEAVMTVRQNDAVSSDSAPSQTLNAEDAANLEQRISWQVGSPSDQGMNDDSDDEFSMSATLNCDTNRPSAVTAFPRFTLKETNSNPNVTLTHATNHEKPRLVSNHSSLNNLPPADGLKFYDSASVPVTKLPKESHKTKKSKKLSPKDEELRILRKKQFQDFLNDSSPGVEI